MVAHCVLCNRDFRSQDALEQHLRDSPAHSSFECTDCDRAFGSQDALEQHLRDSPNHRQNLETPLDAFFRSFSTFNYDPSLPPAMSYAILRRHERWGYNDAASDDAWERYQLALKVELRKWYGSEDDITAWHSLCRAIGVEPLPQTCRQCEDVVRKTHVNIVDLIEWGRHRDDNEERVRTFSSVAKLRAYTKRTGKIFRNTFSQEDDNVVLRHLLRKLL